MADGLAVCHQRCAHGRFKDPEPPPRIKQGFTLTPNRSERCLGTLLSYHPLQGSHVVTKVLLSTGKGKIFNLRNIEKQEEYLYSLYHV
jgi:hypothetical protein